MITRDEIKAASIKKKNLLNLRFPFSIEKLIFKLLNEVGPNLEERKQLYEYILGLEDACVFMRSQLERERVQIMIKEVINPRKLLSLSKKLK